MQNLINGRCGWCGTDELYVAYHDNEWGRLVKEDKILFEFGQNLRLISEIVMEDILLFRCLYYLYTTL